MRTPRKRSKRRRKQQKRRVIITASFIMVVLAGIFIAPALPGKKQAAQERTEAFDSSAKEKGFVYNGETYPFDGHLSNYLIMGIDSRGDVDNYDTQQDAGQADAIFLISLNRAENTVQGLVIPRDTMTEIETFNPAGMSLGTAQDHINIQYAFGDGKTKSCELMKAAVSHLLGGIDIQGYCAVNMDGISVLADGIGGVEVVIPDDSMEAVQPEFKKGSTVLLTGENAEAFVRYRSTEEGQSALVRQERQKVFLQACLEKAQKTAEKDVSFVTGIYEDLKKYMVTNMGNDIFIKLLEASGNQGFSHETIPGEGLKGKYFDEYHVDEDALSQLIIRMFCTKE